MPPNRGLWLVKWLLAIPHYICLIGLGVVFILFTIFAWFGILFTARYPRGLFNFNVGVARWSWRVNFYAFALGTDKYPPFSLQADPAYPADLDIPYPDKLSRGLIWVKWWLLVIPQYFVINILSDLASLLAIFAGFALLFKAKYPSDIFKLVIGMNRWTYRVYAYAFLMRDEYPPFRFWDD
jgi:hypothetical protein